MKKRIAVPYVLLVFTGAVVVFSLFKMNSLQRELEISKTGQSQMQGALTEYQKLLSIDSMLLKGDYNKALRSYSETLKSGNENNMSIPLRIAIAEKLSKFSAAYAAQKELLEKGVLDTLAKEKVATPQEIQRYDAVSFELEKARVQLDQLRSQLKDKSFGEYLTFESKKGNRMHYVGKVKNAKANGYGVAILDTGSRYQGDWIDNQRHGEGTFYWPDGEYYIGSYANDQRNGMGSYYWPNGEKYTGQWKNDKRNGEGAFYDSEGIVITRGLWKEDKLVEEVEKKKK